MLTKEHKNWFREFCNQHPKVFTKIWFLPRNRFHLKDRFGNNYTLSTDEDFPLWVLCYFNNNGFDNSTGIMLNSKKNFDSTIQDILFLAPQTHRSLVARNILSTSLGKTITEKSFTDIAQDFFTKNSDVLKDFRICLDINARIPIYIKYGFKDVCDNTYKITVMLDEKPIFPCFSLVESKHGSEISNFVYKQSDFLAFLNQILKSVPHVSRYRKLNNLLN